MSVARRVVDSTFQKVLTHIGEVVRSIILLIIVCLPLVFALPMWIQHFVFDVPFSSLTINPVAWFGTSSAVLLILFLAAVSLVLGYVYASKMIPTSETTPSATETIPKEEVIEEEEPEIEAETVTEEAEDASRAEAPLEEEGEDDTDASDLES